MLSEESYWKGSDSIDRRVRYAEDYTQEIEDNGQETMHRTNLLVAMYGELTKKPTPTTYASGWRPPSVNEATSNSASASKHLLALAGDVKDTKEGDFAWWCFNHKDDILALPKIDLYMEHPSATVINHSTPWCHLQIVPPKSNLRVYFPNTSSFNLWATYDKKSVKEYA